MADLLTVRIRPAHVEKGRFAAPGSRRRVLWQVHVSFLQLFLPLQLCLNVPANTTMCGSCFVFASLLVTPLFWCWIHLQVLQKRSFQYALILPLLLAAACVAVTTDLGQFLDDQPWVRTTEVALLMWFIFEIVLKVSVNSWRFYWSNLENRFDFLVTMVLLVFELLRNSFALLGISAFVTFVLAYRAVWVIRSLRLLMFFRLFLTNLSRISTSLLRYLLLMFGLFYSFSIVGMGLFAGQLGANNPAVAASSYGQANYYPLNFDDISSAYVALFYQLIVNNWAILVEGCVAATGTRTVRLYSPSPFALVPYLLGPFSSLPHSSPASAFRPFSLRSGISLYSTSSVWSSS